MAVIFDKQNEIIRLDTKNTSYVMAVRDGYLVHLYYGPSLGDGNHSYFFRTQGRAAFSPRMETGEGFSLDDIPFEYPCWGRGDMRSPALEIKNSDGSRIVDLNYVNHTVTAGKPMPKGLPAVYCEDDSEAETLTVLLADKVSGVEVKLIYTLFADTDVITRRAEITNNGTDKCNILKAASACIDFDRDDFEIISNHGTHCRERNIERFPLARGEYRMASRRGASGHVNNPFMIIATKDTTEDSGDCYGTVLVYSGDFASEISGNQYQTARHIVGINPDGFDWPLEAGETFVAPEAALTYSATGITTLSHNYHKLFARRLCRGKYRDVRRPVLLNSWEACYFSFDADRLVKIGECSADLGIELLVIDDGWFGVRNSDNCSLGDWTINPKKFPSGLEGVYKPLKEKGIDLGIWFEPEMISPDSDLYRAHPDWCIHIENRPRSQGRWQLILDLTRKEVRDYLYDSIAAILRTGMIAYVKWDFNRNMTEIGSPVLGAEHQGEVTHRYYLGLYELLERLVTDFPDVLFESCSGGGGRFDAGLLYYMPQVWTSDNSDAIERLKIQHGTSLVYPMSAMSAHVSASPNHQTGHVTPFMTRFTVAFTGSYGYELDPTALSAEEQELVKKTVALYKQYGGMMNSGKYYRLAGPYDVDYCAWCTVSEDKSLCVAGYVLTHVRMYGNNRRVRLKGLDENASYRDALTGDVYTGKQLMGFGVHCPETLEYTSHMWILEKI